MMALTGIVFAMAFVMVQFSAIAYSPRTRALVYPRPHIVSRAWRVHRDIRVRPVHARLGGPQRIGKGPAVRHAPKQIPRV